MIHLLAAVLPPPLARALRRRAGLSIDPSARVAMFVILKGDVSIGPQVVIKPFVRISVNRATLRSHVTIGPGVSVVLHDLHMEPQSSIAPFTFVTGEPGLSRSFLKVGRHSRIFPFSWIDAGYGVTVGSRVGVGGHCLVFTHGSWSNYFRGAPVAHGPVVIEDNVWLPWRVFIMPNVTIGRGAIIGAGSVVTRSVPAGALAGGAPASVIRDTSHRELSSDQVTGLIDEVLAEYLGEHPEHRSARISVGAPAAGDRVDIIVGGTLSGDETDDASVIDVVAETLIIGRAPETARHLANWLTRYGVRLDEVG